jgi:hypothetical protein
VKFAWKLQSSQLAAEFEQSHGIARTVVGRLCCLEWDASVSIPLPVSWPDSDNSQFQFQRWRRSIQPVSERRRACTTSSPREFLLSTKFKVMYLVFHSMAQRFLVLSTEHMMCRSNLAMSNSTAGRHFAFAEHAKAVCRIRLNQKAEYR